MKKPSVRAQVVTRRTYNRPLNDDGTVFETWEQTVDRVISHQKWLWERAKGSKLTENQKKELQDFRALMLDRKVFTSGRTLWLGGTDVAKSREASQFNCSGLKVETVWDVVDLFWLLLQGCGVGFAPVTGTLNGFFKPIKAIETVRSTRTDRGYENNVETWDAETKTWTIKIGDSAESWAKSIGKILAGKYPADKLVLDFSEIRPAGTRLKGYGWLSSGDQQIAPTYIKVAELMNRRAGSLLTRMDILDLCNLLGTVLSSRRSAEIALFNYGDPEWREFAVAKKEFWLHGNEHRQQSNNSLLFWQKPLKSELEEIFKLMEESGGSEPGFINAQAATRRAPWFATVNPCCFTGDMRLLTSEGYKYFKDLVGSDVSIVSFDGSMSSGKVWSNGVKDVVQVKFAGTRNAITCTPDHKFMLNDGSTCEAQNLHKKRVKVFVNTKTTFDRDSAFAGFIQGDGGTGRIDSTSHKSLEVNIGAKDQDVAIMFNLDVSGRVCYSREAMEIAKKFGLSSEPLPNRCLPKNVSGDFLSGLFSANGCVVKDTRVSLKTTCRPLADGVVDVLLHKYGISAFVTTNKPTVVKFANGEYLCKESYDVNIVRFNDLIRFAENISFIQGYKRESLTKAITARSPYVRSVKKLGDREVFDFNEPNNNWGVVEGVVVHNCEILLPNKGFCNLVECDVSKFAGDTHGLHEALRLAARANYRQTCVDFRDGILQESWHLNNQFLRLCGVGITGVAMRPDLAEYDYKQMNRVATFAAYSMADELGLQRPKNVCTLKPSGTLSKVADCTEGVHKPLGRYIFNNINFGIHDPLLPKLRAAGYNVFNHPTDATAVLVTFPIKNDGVEFDVKDGVEVNLESAVDQLERYKMLQSAWADYNVSNTISYSKDEVPAIIDWLLTNWDVYVGVSFIYRTDPTKTAKDLGYLYLPQEVVTKEVWEKYTNTLREFDVESVGGFDELQADECAGGACPIR